MNVSNRILIEHMSDLAPNLRVTYFNHTGIFETQFLSLHVVDFDVITDDFIWCKTKSGMRFGIRLPDIDIAIMEVNNAS